MGSCHWKESDIFLSFSYTNLKMHRYRHEEGMKMFAIFSAWLGYDHMNSNAAFTHLIINQFFMKVRNVDD